MAASALLASLPAAAASPILTIRASGSMAANVGPIMEVRVDGAVVGKVEVRSTTMRDYSFTAGALKAGIKVDVVFTNDGVIDGQDRNLYVAYLSDGISTLMHNVAGSVYDRGPGAKAFDGLDVSAGQGNMYNGGALRLIWPNAPAAAPSAAQQDAARFLQQATFGPTSADIARLISIGQTAWLAEQQAMPFSATFMSTVQKKYDLGDDYRPMGSKYTPFWVGQRFWATAATSPDQLRKRVAFALHQIFLVSQADSNIWPHARAYGQYIDTLNQQAFGNYRNLLEDMALSPVMGIYLSHMRNRKENPATGLMPDENFAREVMQLFSIGLNTRAIAITSALV